MTISSTSLPIVRTFPSWIYLERFGANVGRSSLLLSPFRFRGATLVRNIGSLMGTNLLSRPVPDAGSYKSIKTYNLSNELSVDCDLLAGGSIDELRISDRPMLNTHRGWTRGWQSGMEFKRNGVRCWPRTGGSVYSGEVATHPAWWTAGSAPGSTIGNHDSTLACYADNERQGAWNENIGFSNSVLSILTMPIELDPDGFCGGDDHGLLERDDSSDPAPEQLLPVPYHSIRLRSTIRAIATGVLEVKAQVLLAKDVQQMVVDESWVWDAVRIHLRGEEAPTLFRVGGTTYVMDAESIPGGGGFTYNDQGQFYILERGSVRRGSGAPLASTIANRTSGTIIKECCGRFIGIRMSDGQVRGSQGPALANSRAFLYSDRMDLAAGDARDGARHHFLGARYQMAENVIRSGTVATMHVVTANSLQTLEARIDAITP